MAPKTRVKWKAMTAALFATSSRKKRRISLESVTSLPASNETMLCVTVSPGAGEPMGLEGTSITGPNTGREGTDVAGPSSRGEGTSVASTDSIDMGIDGPCSRVSEEMGSFRRISLVLVARKLLLRLQFILLKRTPQEILKHFAEDWQETLDKVEIKSISLYAYIFLYWN